MANLKELTRRPNRLAPGHRACAGCVPAVAFQQVLNSVEGHVVCGAATGCMEVVTTIYPYTAWNVPYIHNAFDECTCSGGDGNPQQVTQPQANRRANNALHQSFGEHQAKNSFSTRANGA